MAAGHDRLRKTNMMKERFTPRVRMRFLILITGLAGCAWPLTARGGQVWDPALDWSDDTPRNPNGEWSYGEAYEPGGTMSPGNGPIRPRTGTWNGYEHFFEYCTVGRNVSPSASWLPPEQGGVWLEPGQIGLNAGRDDVDKVAVLRWTAPVSARVKVEVEFTGNHIPSRPDDPGTVSKVYVLKASDIVWSGEVRGFVGCSIDGTKYPRKGPAPVQSWSGDLTVAAGGTINFASDEGGAYEGGYSEFVGLKARITLIETAWTADDSGEVAPAPDWKNMLKPKGRPGPELTLAADGNPMYTVLLPRDPTTQEQKAAEELVRWLFGITEAEFPVAREGREEAVSTRVISIGRTSLSAAQGLSAAKADLGNEGYAIDLAGENLFLVGGTKRGPINAVYALLEEDLGCRWYDAQSRTLPHAPTLKVSPVPRSFVPVLEIRDPYYLEAFDVNWSLRNRTLSPAAAIPEPWGGYVDYDGLPAHTYNALVPPGKYFAAHPEYYSELNGQRQPRQLCLTNPDVLTIAIAGVRDHLAKSPDAEIVSVSPNDGYGYCECPVCRAIDEAEGTRMGTLLRFVNAVADAIRIEHPHVQVSTLAYLGTIEPPKSIRPRENVAIRICTDAHAWFKPFYWITDAPRYLPVTETRDFSAMMKAWNAVGARTHVWDYTINFSHYLAPMPNMPVVGPNIRFLISNGARGIMLQGDSLGLGSERAALRCWVWAKQLWDPARDTRELMHDFIRGYYGAAAEPIYRYNERLWEIWEHYHAMEVDAPDNALRSGIRFDPDNRFLSRAFLQEAGQLFNQAESLADSPALRRRVRLAKLPVLYAKLSQAVGFFEDNGNFKSGDPEPFGGVDTCREMINEFERTCRGSSISIIREGGMDASASLVRTWRSTLDRARTVAGSE